MNRARSATVVAALLLGGCGVQPSGVTDAAEAPTGIAPGVTLYFLDQNGTLRPQQRRSGRLGTVAEAVTLLLYGPGQSGLRTGISPSESPRAEAVTTPGTIELRLPLAAGEVTPPGADQIVCTALATHIQSGGPARTTVRLIFTIPEPGSDTPRTCPLISPRAPGR
ncbi:hypothetical protein Asp14428_15350 [Actinoplanes sp. NBRC 14428]|uniref:Uncharacterized protein n=1 Tax=Pseudosporangium ferrugineum TaxID=439699 RepID=A0A2T0SAR8_9ACTN|nr:hypothetical protein [Pseudosporangium ferrugineum]PRY30525.1 hypothetical protein CLV70_10477 [Pseudosporangium ferrugineum]BCJ50060.1 hypothetical protein Asp14428_15350 [Actinoplanes sp. NBRC 14428]